VTLDGSTVFWVTTVVQCFGWL